jgi:hypothetical protein
MFIVTLPAVPITNEENTERQEAITASASRDSGGKADSNIDFTDS